MATRHRQREVALQMLFQFDASGLQKEQVVTLFRESFAEGSLPDEFSINLFGSVADNLTHLDGIIEESSDNWRLERMSLVDRNILRIGAAEIMFADDVPTKVAINESVELAKRFGTVESAGFVNGILDRVAREQNKI